MAYKPGRKNVDIYAKYDRKRQQKAENRSNIKLFGYRSGKSYKIIIATFYYLLAIAFVLYSVIGETIHFKFEALDYVLMVSRYIFITIMALSPALFLSDFKYIEKIPFFNKKNAFDNVKGFILVFMICTFMYQMDIYVMTDTWKNSRDAYEATLEKEFAKKNQELMKQIESNNATTKVNKETVNKNK